MNSIYARRANGDNVEVGWYWDCTNTGTLPQNFTRMQSAIAGTSERNAASHGIVSNTYEPYELRRVVPNDTWQVYINGALDYTYYSTGIGSSYATVGAERNTLNDDGRGSWTYVKYKKHGTTTYYYWPSARTDTNSSNVSLDNDPDYGLYREKLGNSNHQVYVDNHLN